MGALPSLHARLAGFVCDTLDYPYRNFVPEAPSLTAMEHYYRGIDLFDQRKYDEAVGFLEKAPAEEPTYTGPRKTLESCSTFLKDFKRARQTREISSSPNCCAGSSAVWLSVPFSLTARWSRNPLPAALPRNSCSGSHRNIPPFCAATPPPK
ncbi:MAG: tetratricopeptide repeat protein [Spirochaetota bacterium]|nr:tetratricopeptide repeat protein [Spirochaetota bacterium]